MFQDILHWRRGPNSPHSSHCSHAQTRAREHAHTCTHAHMRANIHTQKRVRTHLYDSFPMRHGLPISLPVRNQKERTQTAARRPPELDIAVQPNAARDNVDAVQAASSGELRGTLRELRGVRHHRLQPPLPGCGVSLPHVVAQTCHGHVTDISWTMETRTFALCPCIAKRCLISAD